MVFLLICLYAMLTVHFQLYSRNLDSKTFSTITKQTLCVKNYRHNCFFLRKTDHFECYGKISRQQPLQKSVVTTAVIGWLMIDHRLKCCRFNLEFVNCTFVLDTNAILLAPISKFYALVTFYMLHCVISLAILAIQSLVKPSLLSTHYIV